MSKFFLTEQAQQDRGEIFDYIASNNSLAAKKVDKRFKEVFQFLAGSPYSGHKRDDLTNLNVRFFTVYSYMIIYDPETFPLKIVRILSSFRDINKLI